MRLDDETFWRHPRIATTCSGTRPLWARPLREEKDADYLEKGGAQGGLARIRTQRARLELVAFSRGS